MRENSTGYRNTRFRKCMLLLVAWQFFHGY